EVLRDRAAVRASRTRAAASQRESLPMRAAASSRSVVEVSVHLTVRATWTSLPRIPLRKSYGQPRCLLAHAQSSGAHKCGTECPQRMHCQEGIREGVEPLLWLGS